MPDITGANATFALSVPDVFPAPIQLQGFAADDVFDVDPIESAEVLIGVDGILSAGFVFSLVRQTIALQADSDSNALFEAWHAANIVARTNFFAQGIVILTAIDTKWVLANGALTSFPPMPNVHRLLQPRRYGVTWQSVSPAIP